MIIHHVGRLYAETLLAVSVAIILAVIIDIIIPEPKPTEKVWTTRLLILVQLVIDVTAIFFIIYFANQLGLLDQETPVGIAALIMVVTVFFLMQVQISDRVRMLYTKRTRSIQKWYRVSQITRLFRVAMKGQSTPLVP